MILLLARLINVTSLQLCHAAGKLPLSWLKPAHEHMHRLCLTCCRLYAGTCFQHASAGQNLGKHATKDVHCQAMLLVRSHLQKGCAECKVTCCKCCHVATKRQ